MRSPVQLYESLLLWIAEVPSWQAVVVILLGTFVLAKVLAVAVDFLAPKITTQTQSRIDDILVERSPMALYTTVLIAGVYLSVVAVAVPDRVQVVLENVLVTLLVIVWSVVVIRVGREVSELGKDRQNVDNGLIPIIQNIWTIVVSGIGAFSVMSLWGVNVTPFLASAGILGIGIGFAARDTIANFFGSIALYIDGTYAVGDYIVLDSGEEGWVSDISIRSTQIRTRDDLMVTVPNSMLNSGKVVNESKPTPKRRMRVHVGVDYVEDVDEVVAVLKQVAVEEEMVDETPEPQVVFKDFKDSSLGFILLAWIPNPATRVKVEHKLNRRIQQRFAEEGISIPYPQRVVSDRDSEVELE